MIDVNIITNDPDVADLLDPTSYEPHNERFLIRKIRDVVERSKSVPRTPATSFPHILGAAITQPRTIESSRRGPSFSAIVRKIQEGGPTLITTSGVLARHKDYLITHVYKDSEEQRRHLQRAARRLPSLVFRFVHPLAVRGNTHRQFREGRRVVSSEPYVFLPPDLASELLAHDVMPTHQRTQVGLVTRELAEDIAPREFGGSQSVIFSGRITGFGGKNPFRSSAPMDFQRLLRTAKGQFLRSIRRGAVIPSVIGAVMTTKSIMNRMKKLNREGRL